MATNGTRGSRRAPRRALAVLTAVAAAAVLVVACGGGTGTDGAGSAGSTGATSAPGGPANDPARATPLPEPVQELDIDGRDYTFTITPDASNALKPGWTLVRFHNVGAEAHQVMFAQLKDGVDMAELAAAGANDSSGAGAIEFVDMMGGVSYIDPGHDITALVELHEGVALAMCYVPDAHGVAHALLGMSTALTVSASTDDAAPAKAATGRDLVNGTIELSADGYRFPEELSAGWYHVVNTDSSLHELSLLRLAEPIDDDRASTMVEDLAANRAPAVELDAVGGMGAISAGFDGYLLLDLAPGDYLAVDFMPDPGDPRPHMVDGYYDLFTV